MYLNTKFVQMKFCICLTNNIYNIENLYAAKIFKQYP